MGFLNALKRSLYPYTSKYISNAILVEGILKDCNEPFCCLFIDNSLFANYMSAKAFKQHPRILKQWKILMPSLKRIIKDEHNKIDLCIAVLPIRYESDFRDLYKFKTCKWVRQVLDISGPWEEIKKGFHKNAKEVNRTIRKYGYSHKISHDLNDLDTFYRQMYLPSITKFGDGARIIKYEWMKSFFSKGFLLIIMDGNNAISACLCSERDSTLSLRILGVLNGDEAYIKRGAQSAIYHFAISYAKENGFKEVDFELSRSSLDGVYWYKSRWGATVYPYDESKTRVYFIIPRHSEKVVSFFKNNPAIIQTDEGLSGLVGMSESRDISDESVEYLTRRYYSPGLKSLHLLTPDSQETIKYAFNRSDGNQLKH